MDENLFDSGPIIEGLDDVVTLSLLVATILIVVSVIFIYWPRRRQSIGIHPSVISAVNSVQEHLHNEASAPPEEDEGSFRNFSDPDRICPICLNPASFAVLTNCGHLFCCNCFYLYWQYSGNVMRPVKCAVCRSVVSVLMPKVVQGERDNNMQEASRSDTQMNDYNYRFSGAPRPILDYIRDIPVMIPYMLRFLFSINGIMTMFRIRVLFCLIGIFAYVIFPFDILPEAVYGIFGFIDDILVAIALMAYAIIMFRRLIADRHLRFDRNVFADD
uniref:E3 ubiquitin-protein ligase RNF170 n=1 Tax=Syphacia muris TaxID=451379 RepID=A0A0N5ATN3_9BILA